MGFGISHQKAGLNWAGRYKEWSRERALAKAWRFWLQHKRGQGSGFRVQGSGNGNGEHAKWRRITGITSAVEGVLTAKERKAGLKRLVDRIKELATEDTENTEKRQEGKEPTLMQPWGVGVEEWAGKDEHSIESLCIRDGTTDEHRWTRMAKRARHGDTETRRRGDGAQRDTRAGTPVLPEAIKVLQDDGGGLLL
ncbi:MAG: hypothetical protein NTW87_16905 [Planctomycetota bacterium]|nr:hypothetical protein [Planctomycetota bacterium]